MHTITITQTHTDFTRTPRAERMGCSPERSERCVRDAVVTGQDDRSLGYSVIQWSIFILRSAKWGHSGGLTECIPHLHHESSAAYYSCPAQGGHAFILSKRLCVRACMLALQCLSARQLLVHDICPKHRTKAWIQPMWQGAGCLMRKWMRGDIHCVLLFLTPPVLNRLPFRPTEQAAGRHRKQRRTRLHVIHLRENAKYRRTNTFNHCRGKNDKTAA